MLLQFNVTNVLSFKNEAILDLVADADNAHENNLISFNKERVLPAVAIYGANAAGKSNLNRALTAAIMFVRNSASMQIDSTINVIPFLLDDESREGKTRFDFIYVYEGIKYEYGFVADTFRVYEEYLYEYRTAKPSMIFERENVNEYRYTSSLKKTLKQYEQKNTDNKLFLATATLWNCKETERAFRFFAQGIDTYDLRSIEGQMLDALEKDETGDLRAFVRRCLKYADINISDYEFTVKKRRQEVPFANIKDWELKTYHEVEVNGDTRKYEFPFIYESGGTKLFFSYCTIIYHALKEGKTIVIDEIDNGLHPMLVKAIVDLFVNSNVNSNGAQLIFNTHDVELLNLEYMRRDQFYFVEKSDATGESELFSLADFSVRKNDRIHKGYMLGRYGALPEIGGFEW